MQTVDDAMADIRDARLLAGAALIIYVAALFLPLWLGTVYLGSGHWENAFPTDLGARLTIGFLVHDFTVPLIISIGLLIMSRGRLDLAAGVFLGAGLFRHPRRCGASALSGVPYPSAHSDVHRVPRGGAAPARRVPKRRPPAARCAASPFMSVPDGEADLRAPLETLDPKARDDLRDALIHGQADRDAISSRPSRSQSVRLSAHALGRRFARRVHVLAYQLGCRAGRSERCLRVDQEANRRGQSCFRVLRIGLCLHHLGSGILDAHQGFVDVAHGPHRTGLVHPGPPTAPDP
jgi:hypothetical protein